MDKSICVAVKGTVSIDANEYRDLVTAQAYLDVIIEAANGGKSYIVDNVVEVVSRLANPVITAKEQTSGGEDGETHA